MLLHAQQHVASDAASAPKYDVDLSRRPTAAETTHHTLVEVGSGDSGDMCNIANPMQCKGLKHSEVSSVPSCGRVHQALETNMPCK